MRARILVGVAFAGAIATLTGARALTAPRSCEALASLALPHATVTLAQTVAAGAFLPPNDTPGDDTPPPNPRAFSGLPAFCRVAATLRPTADSDIKIEVWIPAANWNGKLQAVGNGAFNGNIAYPAMATALVRGYATSSTDTGHVGNTAAFAMGHPEKVTDFAWRAVHEMTVSAKSIISAQADSAPKFYERVLGRRVRAQGSAAFPGFQRHRGRCARSTDRSRGAGDPRRSGAGERRIGALVTTRRACARRSCL